MVRGASDTRKGEQYDIKRTSAKIFRGELKNSFAISIGGMANDNMSAYAYANLLKYLGMEDKPIKIYDLFQFIPLVDLEVIDRLGGDFVHAQRPRYRFNLDQREWRPGFLHDGTPATIQPNSNRFERKTGAFT